MCSHWRASRKGGCWWPLTLNFKIICYINLHLKSNSYTVYSLIDMHALIDAHPPFSNSFFLNSSCNFVHFHDKGVYIFTTSPTNDPSNSPRLAKTKYSNAHYINLILNGHEFKILYVWRKSNKYNKNRQKSSLQTHKHIGWFHCYAHACCHLAKVKYIFIWMAMVALIGHLHFEPVMNAHYRSIATRSARLLGNIQYLHLYEMLNAAKYTHLTDLMSCF